MNSSRPHICFVAPHAYPVLAENEELAFVGGAELQQVLVARELARRGFPVSMICLNFGQEDRCEVDGIVVYRAFRPDEGVPVLRFLWPRLTSLWRCLRRVDADIYYQRGAGMLTGVVARWCRQHRRKSVFAMAGATKIHIRRDRWLFEYGIRTADRIVVQNTHQARAVLDEFGRSSTLIPNYQPPVVPPPQRGSERGLLWVSTIRRVKRPWLVLDLAQALPDLHFTMVGGRDLLDKSLYDEVQARAETLPNVSFHGFVPYSAVHRYFDRAAVFLNTSESEGFPNTFLQSWGRGIPTISFVDVGARIAEHPVGCVVASVDEMAAAIRELLADDAQRARLGDIGRRYVSENHGLERVIPMYEALCADLLAPG